MTFPMEDRDVLFTSAFALVLIFSFSFSLPAIAATTGTIAGNVLDSRTKKPIANAVVTIEETRFMAVTDSNGFYAIIGVPPGTYSVTARVAGYVPETRKGIMVSADLRTAVDFSLLPVAVEIKEITVTAEKPLIRKDLTQTARIMGRSEIRRVPRETVDLLLQLQAGIVQSYRRAIGASTEGIHIRGGRAGEIGFYVDGVPIRGPLFYDEGIRMSTNAVEEIQVVTGGFNAEYGNALSGVINIVTGEGRKGGQIVYRYGFVPKHFGEPIYWPWLNPDAGYRPENIELFSGVDENGRPYAVFLGKPQPYQRVWSGKEIFAGDKSFVWDDGKEYKLEWFEVFPGVWTNIENMRSVKVKVGGREEEISLERYAGLYRYNPEDPESDKDYGLKPEQRLQIYLAGPLFENALSYSFSADILASDGYLPNQHRDQFITHGKLKFMPAKDIKISLSGLWEYAKYKLYPGYILDNQLKDWRYNLDCTPWRWRNNLLITANLSHSLSPNTFYSLTFGCLSTYFKLAQEGKWWDPTPGADNSAIRNPFLTAANTTYYIVAGDNNMWQRDETKSYIGKAEVVSQLNPYHQIKVGAELDLTRIRRMAIANWGSGNLYVDSYFVSPKYFMAFFQDKMDFEGMIVNIGLRYELYDPEAYMPSDKFDPIVLNPDGTIKYDEMGYPIIKNPKRAGVKHCISPRLGISHPISDRDKIHFTYGHYYQMPRGSDLFENMNYDMRGAVRRVGNPDLKPERTVSYEVGLEHQVTKDSIFAITGFSKDMDNLVSSEHVDIPNDYNRWINLDYAHSQGLEITLAKKRGKYLGGSISYTYSVSKGKASDRSQGYLSYYYQQPLPVESHYMDWDQRHTIALNLNMQTPRGYGPRIWFLRPFAGWEVDLVATYGSGLPYTPNPRNPVPDWNSKRMPPTKNVDVRISKSFVVMDIGYLLFLDVRNAFNTMNLLDVMEPTAYDRYGRPMDETKHTDPEAWGPPRTVYLGLGASW